ncbi:integrase [Microvirga brassicacearum]|uniref:Integrase n=2 Tax=Microvirga brassicacearum TaxID=2580413 RepID=A0A5N3PHS3_9HYPH|nr:integrase [Microvirga brassicacearum]
MVGIKNLRYLIEDRDRHGNPRLYVRAPGQKKIRIREIPGTPEFNAAYEDAMAGIARTKPDKAAPAAPAVVKGSFRALCIAYYASGEFKGLDQSTRNWRQRALDKIAEKRGDDKVSVIEPKHIRILRDELVDTPGAANARLKALKALFVWAVGAGESRFNPAREIKLIRYSSSGHHSWTLDEVTKFEERHPIGSKARLACAIMLYTACRREDVVRLGKQHIRGGRIRFIQAKNEDREPIQIDIPVHPDLAEVIDKTPSGHLTFMVTEYGKPFTANGFGNWFRDRCDEAGLPNCSAHGLRKATAARLAERGAGPYEIMSITGHQSLEEVERYTKAAEKIALSNRAMARLGKAKPRTK